MKKILLFCLVQSMLISLFANAKKEAVLQVDSMHINKGNLKPNTNYYYEFVLKNIGDTVAIIEEVQSTCGGVTPSIDKKIILPGQRCRISCIYESGSKTGPFNKTINVLTNTKITGKYQPNMQTGTWHDGRAFVYFLMEGNVIDEMSTTENRVVVSESIAENLVIFDALSKTSGDIPEGPYYEFNFKMQNISKEPVIIQNVRTSCGCVVGNWNKEPLLPGQSTTIKVTYHTQGRPGSYTKTATVTLNKGVVVTLTVSGNVIERPADNDNTPPQPALLKN